MRATAILVRWSGGWRWVEDDDPEGPRIETCQGHSGDSREVLRKAQAEVRTYRYGQTQITVGVRPGVLDGIIEGDPVHVDGAWRELEAVTATLDDQTGLWNDVPQFGTVLDDDAEERMDRTLRAIGGLNQGTSHIARPVAPLQQPNVRP